MNSFGEFQVVMEVSGLKKVQNVEYVMQESGSKRKLDLTAPWDSVLLPCRKVDMSMAFREVAGIYAIVSRTENETQDSNKGSEIQWHADISTFPANHSCTALTASCC
jgi:hypothetical protein